MTPDGSATSGRIQEKRTRLRLACNSPQLLQQLQGRHEDYVSLIAAGDLAAALDFPDRLHGLIIDAALIPVNDFRPFVHKLRDLHATGRYVATLLICAPDKPVSPRGAFMAGISATLEGPADDDALRAAYDTLVDTARLWRELEEDSFIKRKTAICLSSMRGEHRPVSTLMDSVESRISPVGFTNFITLFAHEASISEGDVAGKHLHTPNSLFKACDQLAIPRSHLVRKISDYTKLNQVSRIVPETLVPGVLPPEFCSRNQLVPLQLYSDRFSLVFGNPFDWALVSAMQQLKIARDHKHLCVADPEAIQFVLSARKGRFTGVLPTTRPGINLTSLEIDFSQDVQHLCDYLLESAVKMRASDIHIEPKTGMTLVRFRIDGDLHDILCLDDIGRRVIARYKMLGKIDISEQRRPQDGSLDTTILNRRYSLRMATSATPDGESIAIRILDTDAGMLSLMELGMNARQEQSVVQLAARHNGMVLFVGPTGCGKTTSIYSLLSHINCQKRSLVSVEDPVEYHISAAIQHNVNLKAGVTFEALLKSSVRQDPDILFIGEIRDPASAQIAMDFTSTGHLTFSSLHTINAVSAIFRLERLGISRRVMSESLLAIVAQKLVKRVCPECKEIGPIDAEERAMLARFVNDPPEMVAHPKGCDFCNHTGYFGRTGVYEIVHFTPHLMEMLLANRTITDIRHELTRQGEFLISDHVIDKVRQLICSPRDAIEAVLIEELALTCSDSADTPPPAVPEQPGEQIEVVPQRLLIIDDDPAILDILSRTLPPYGFTCDQAADGIDALLKVGKNTYDLIISDIMMPNLDGFKLLEMLTLKGICVPLMFMTAFTSPDNEQRARELGAREFIRKPLELKSIVNLINHVLDQEKKTCCS